MKKVIAVFLAVLVIFGTTSVALAAVAPGDVNLIDETQPEEEKTTRNIKNEDGLVVPWNFEQLKMSVIFKIIEKIFLFIKNLFGGNKGDDADKEGATAVEDAGKWLDELISEINSKIDSHNTTAPQTP